MAVVVDVLSEVAGGRGGGGGGGGHFLAIP